MEENKQNDFFSEENTCRLLEDSLEDLKAHFRGEPSHCREMLVTLTEDGTLIRQEITRNMKVEK